MQPPIPFARIIQHYCDKQVLESMHPQKLKEELYDILTLADFMLAKAPTKIKTMINMTREEEIQLKRRVDEVTVNDLPQIQNTNLFLARDMIAKSFKYNAEQQEYDDFIEQTKAQQQIKLKYFQSEWSPEREVKWLNIYQKTKHCLFLQNNKYRIIVDLRLSNNKEEYVWNVKKLQSKNVNFFQNNLFQELYACLPKIQEKYKQQSEYYMLSSLYRFLDFIQLTLYKRKVLILFQSFSFEHQMTKYKFEFSQFLQDQIPRFKVIDQTNQIQLQIVYRNSEMLGCIEMCGSSFYSQEITIIPSPDQLLKLMKKLLKFRGLLNYVNREYNQLFQQFKQCCFFKYGGKVWAINPNKITPLKRDDCEQQGLYISNFQNQEDSSILLKIQQTYRITSKRVSQNFITQLLKHNKERPQALFKHLISINKLSNNNNTDSQLNDYEIDKKQIVYKFSRKFYQEQKLRQSVERQGDDHSFNNFLLQAKIDFNFMDLKVTCNRHKQPTLPITEAYLPTNWKNYRKQKIDEDTLDETKVFDCIQYEKEHFLMERIYDKKLNEQNKALFKLELQY